MDILEKIMVERSKTRKEIVSIKLRSIPKKFSSGKDNQTHRFSLIIKCWDSEEIENIDGNEVGNYCDIDFYQKQKHII